VELEESQIYQRKMVEGVYEWQWSRKKGLWRDRHQVILVVRIKRFVKED
jgi:hypothetical protein